MDAIFLHISSERGVVETDQWLLPVTKNTYPPTKVGEMFDQLSSQVVSPTTNWEPPVIRMKGIDSLILPTNFVASPQHQTSQLFGKLPRSSRFRSWLVPPWFIWKRMVRRLSNNEGEIPDVPLFRLWWSIPECSMRIQWDSLSSERIEPGFVMKKLGRWLVYRKVI